MKKLFIALALLAGFALGSPVARAQFADQSTYVATPGGTANAITLSVSNWSRNLPGVELRFIPTAINTGATTVVVNGVGSPVALKKKTWQGLVALSGGELVPTQIAAVTFDGTQWQLVDGPPPAPEPQGYLTPCQVSSPSPVSGCLGGFPVPIGNVIAATTLYYEGMTGNQVPIFNGATFVSRAVTESQMTLILSASANLANHIYDVCVYDNNGTPAIGTSIGWSGFAAGAGNRGTGAGSAQIVKVNGIWTNAVAAMVTNNNVSVEVPANRCTIVASILIDAANGQTSLYRTYGQSRKWGVWNFYNRQQIVMQMGDSTTVWGNNSGAIRPSNGSVLNNITIFTGIPEEPVDVEFRQYNGTNAAALVAFETASGIGFNSTGVFSGSVGRGAGFDYFATTNIARLIVPPATGINVLYALEQLVTAPAGGVLFYGTPLYMVMTAKYRG